MIKKIYSKIIKYVKPKYLLQTKIRTCGCCNKKSIVLKLNEWDEFTRCIRCSANARYEHLALCLRKENLENKKIVELDDRSPLKRMLSHYHGYTRTYFSDKVNNGYISKNGAICEDITNLTFEDNSIDIMISSDVLEHVCNIEKAFAETKRVLKHGGKHFFTIPMYNGKTTQRAKIENGKIINILPPIYHCDPESDSDGYILVFWDFGNDLADYYSNSEAKLSIIDGPFGKEGKVVWCYEKY